MSIPLRMFAIASLLACLFSTPIKEGPAAVVVIFALALSFTAGAFEFLISARGAGK